MGDVKDMLDTDEGSFPPPVCAVLANSLFLAAGDFHGVAEEADQVPLSSRCFSVHGVASDSLQPAAEDKGPVIVAGVSAWRWHGNLYFFHQCIGRRAQQCVPSCTFKAMGNAKASAQ